jgi:hypothetical protein
VFAHSANGQVSDVLVQVLSSSHECRRKDFVNSRTLFLTFHGSSATRQVSPRSC